MCKVLIIPLGLKNLCGFCSWLYFENCVCIHIGFLILFVCFALFCKLTGVLVLTIGLGHRMYCILASWLLCIVLAPVSVTPDANGTSPSTAVAMYTSGATGVHGSFAKAQRHFVIVGRNWTVEQSWDEDGVAGVVWQAVSPTYLWLIWFWCS